MPCPDQAGRSMRIGTASIRVGALLAATFLSSASMLPFQSSEALDETTHAKPREHEKHHHHHHELNNEAAELLRMELANSPGKGQPPPPPHLASSSRGPHVPCFNFDSQPHDLLLHATSFLPDPQASARGGCRDDLAEELLRQLANWSSHPGSCDASSQLTTGGAMYGVGSVVNSWLKPMSFAVATDRPLWSPRIGGFQENPRRRVETDRPVRCTVDSTACFFEPLSRCESFPELANDPAFPRGISPLDKVLDPYSLTVAKTDAGGLPLNVPSRYRRRGHFWYTSQLLAYLMRPGAAFRKVLAEAKERAGFGQLPAGAERPLLSLHVRHGDSCSGDRKRVCDPLAAYMNASVLPMAAKYGVKTIYLATDGDEVVADTALFPQFTWLYLPAGDAAGADRGELKKTQWEKNVKKGLLDTYGEMQAAFVDLLLLAEGDAFVGKFTSNMDRIAYSLMAARKRGLAPYVSLDSPWCSDWGKGAGVNLKDPTHHWLC